MAERSAAEQQLARVTVLADPRFLPPLTNLVAGVATTVWLD
jgi:hypothetical protein